MKKISKLKFELFPRTTLVGRENLVVVRLEEAEAFGVFGRGRFVRPSVLRLPRGEEDLDVGRRRRTRAA